MAAQVTFSYRKYRSVHGRGPSGVGLWFFKFGEEVLQAQGTLTAAKQKVAKEAVLLGLPWHGEVLP